MKDLLWGLGCGSRVEHLPHMLNALGLILSAKNISYRLNTERLIIYRQ